MERGFISVSQYRLFKSIDSEACLSLPELRMKCAADKKAAAVCSEIMLTHEVIKSRMVMSSQIEEWCILPMAVMGNEKDVI